MNPDFRLRPGDLCMSEAMPFQQHHEAKVVVPIADCLTPTFFLNIKDRLRPGDKVTICRFADHTAQRLAETADLRIVEKSNDGVRLHLIGEIVEIPAADAVSEAPADAGPAPRYASGNWKAEFKGPTYRWCLVDQAGEIHLKGIEDKADAHAMARGDMALPAAALEAA